MPVIKISNSEQLSNEISQSDDIIIDFYADWCTPCVEKAPIFEAQSKKTNIKFVKINIDNLSKDEMDEYNITSIPFLKRYSKGNLIKERHGLSTEILNYMMMPI